MPHHAAHPLASLHVDVWRRSLACGMIRRQKLPGRHTICKYYARDVSCRTSTCGMMRHITSKILQKSNQFWFLHYVMHANTRWHAVRECSQRFTCVWLERQRTSTHVDVQYVNGPLEPEQDRQTDTLTDRCAQTHHHPHLR